MTKQEKIREGFAREICRLDRSWWEKLTDADKEYYLGKANDYLAYLHSQGAVLKVDRELPDVESIDIENLSTRAALRYLKSQYNNFEAVESLIEEEKDAH